MRITHRTDCLAPIAAWPPKGRKWNELRASLPSSTNLVGMRLYHLSISVLPTQVETNNRVVTLVGRARIAPAGGEAMAFLHGFSRSSGTHGDSRVTPHGREPAHRV